MLSGKFVGTVTWGFSKCHGVYHIWQYPLHIEMDGFVRSKVLRFIIIIIVDIVVV